MLNVHGKGVGWSTKMELVRTKRGGRRGKSRSFCDNLITECLLRSFGSPNNLFSQLRNLLNLKNVRGGRVQNF